MSQTTLLRYIGGKSLFAHEITPYIKVPYTGVYVEPFVGGGSVGIAIASTTAYKNIRVVLNDFDPDVANFWRHVIHPNKAEATLLLERVQALHPTLELHTQMKASNPTDLGERALRFWFLNRTSHAASFNKRPLGGRKQANPDSDIASRFKPDLLIPEFKRVRQILIGRTEVYNVDFGDIMAKAQPDWAAYLDPPYYDRNLYDVSFSVADHERLHAMLMTTSADWVLSYQEHPAVLDLYKDADVRMMQANHSMHKRKRNELIITPRK
jgi:DNA adenine methylase